MNPMLVTINLNPTFIRSSLSHQTDNVSIIELVEIL